MKSLTSLEKLESKVVWLKRKCRKRGISIPERPPRTHPWAYIEDLEVALGIVTETIDPDTGKVRRSG